MRKHWIRIIGLIVILVGIAFIASPIASGEYINEHRRLATVSFLVAGVVEIVLGCYVVVKNKL